MSRVCGVSMVSRMSRVSRVSMVNAIKKGCSTQSIIGLASDLLEILCSHREK